VAPEVFAAREEASRPPESQFFLVLAELSVAPASTADRGSVSESPVFVCDSVKKLSSSEGIIRNQSLPNTVVDYQTSVQRDILLKDRWAAQ
jgi:hypothetical protein